MENYTTSWVKTLLVVVIPLCIGSCTRDSGAIQETEYSKKIVGEWLGKVGDLKESMKINNDSTFVCQLYPTGFIANTLAQGVQGTISGKWKVTGKTITLYITDEKNERPENDSTSSTIVSFKENELVLKSDGGDSSLFQRAGFF